MVDIKPLLAPPKVEIHRRPVVHLCVVDTHRAHPAFHIRQWSVGGPHVVILRYGDIFHRGPQPEPLGEKVPILLRVVLPLPVLLLDFRI